MIDVVQAVSEHLRNNYFDVVVSAWHAGYYMTPLRAMQEYLETVTETKKIRSTK